MAKQIRISKNRPSWVARAVFIVFISSLSSITWCEDLKFSEREIGRLAGLALMLVDPRLAVAARAAETYEEIDEVVEVADDSATGEPDAVLDESTWHEDVITDCFNPTVAGGSQ